MSKGYSVTVEAMKSLGNSVEQVKAYQVQISSVTKSLESLNSVYELELQDAKKHLNSINKFYNSISGVMANLIDTSKDTDTLRQEVGNLASNMKSLNTIYGNMLTAMASGAKKA
jgi:gliding motility-associated protein GldL